MLNQADCSESPWDRGGIICISLSGNLSGARTQNIFHHRTNWIRENRSRIHEHTISLRFLGIILRVLRFEVSVYYVYITNQFQITFAQGGRGVKSVVEVPVWIARRKTLKTFVPVTSKNSASDAGGGGRGGFSGTSCDLVTQGHAGSRDVWDLNSVMQQGWRLNQSGLCHVRMNNAVKIMQG